MLTRANTHVLFHGLRLEPSFSRVIAIEPGDPEYKLLRQARSEIRAAIRAAFRAFRTHFADPSALFKNRDLHANAIARGIQQLEVRFLTQGSFAYGTIVRPAQPPRQGIDLDDGVYVPMPFHNGIPVIPSDALFAVIQRALTPIVEKNKWRFKRKDTCVRIILSRNNEHIDLPLFAVEQAEFDLVAKTYERDAGFSFQKSRDLNEALRQSPGRYRLTKGKILLADRENDWTPSDPKAIQDWFEACVTRFGPVLRRVSRYSKAWRDVAWEKCCVSSLALMVTCVETLAKLEQRPAEDRDDLLMLKVAEHLSKAFSEGQIRNPVDGSRLDKDWTAQQRMELVARAKSMEAELRAALYQTMDRELVVKQLRRVFGARMPNAPTAIDIVPTKQTAAVLRTRPAAAAMPIVGTSTSA